VPRRVKFLRRHCEQERRAVGGKRAIIRDTVVNFDVYSVSALDITYNMYAETHFFHTTISWCSLWSRLMMLESTDSEDPALISHDIIFEVFRDCILYRPY